MRVELSDALVKRREELAMQPLTKRKGSTYSLHVYRPREGQCWTEENPG